MQRGGEWLQQRMRGHGNSRIAEGFCMTTILYCTGAMAIVGSLNDALLRDATVLGLVGAGGIGAPLIFAMNSYRWNEAGSILAGLIVLVLIVEWISTKIRVKLARG